MCVAGRALPGCQHSVSLVQAIWKSQRPTPGHRYVLWHVRRNNEMRAALFARDVLGLPIRTVFTSAAQRRHSTIPRWLISRMDAVIATTEAAASFVPNVHAVVHHGVDTDRFYPAEDRQLAWKKLGYPGKYGIATIGRVRPEKGTDVFVDAMIQVLPRHPEVTALVMGKTSPSQRRFQRELQQRIAAASLSHRILFTGEISWTQLPAIIRGVSLLITPARYEGYGLTPLEAMASGVPVIATDQGNYSALIGNDEAGTLVATPDPTPIANSVNRLITNPIEMKQKGLQARSRAVDLFDLSSELGGIHKTYEALWV